MAKIINPEKKKKNSIDNKLWLFLCSVKLAVIIIVILAVACIVGTLIVQMKPYEEYVERFGETIAKIFYYTQFTDIFHSYWFAFLLILLCINLGSCTIKRWRNTILQLGFQLTHISIILILIGSLIDFQFGEKGGVNVYEGRYVDYYLNRADYKKIPLGFQLYCDDFLIEKHPPKFKLVYFVKDIDRQKTMPIRLGKTVNVPGSNYTITFKEYYPDAEYMETPINVSSAPNNPAVYVQLSDSVKVTAEGWLIGKGRNGYSDDKRDIKIEYIWANDEKDYDKLTKTVGANPKPTLSIDLEEKNIHKNIVTVEGRTLEIEDTNYTVDIKEVAFDYARKNKPLIEQQPNNPAVRVEIIGPDGIDTRWAFSRYPDYWDQGHQTKYKDIKLTFNFPEDFSIASNKVRIIQSKDGKPVFSYINNDKIISLTEWEIDKSYDIGEIGVQLKIVKYFPSYSVKKEVVKKSDDHEGHNHGPGEHVENPALLVDIYGPRGIEEFWLLSENPPIWYSDKNLALLYERSGMEIKDYKSILRIVENGQTVLKKTIEVNDPLKYKGYVFYQSSYDPEGGKYTGLQVTKNPGLAVVYAGFIILCVGVVFIFYIKPFLKRRTSSTSE